MQLAQLYFKNHAIKISCLDTITATTQHGILGAALALLPNGAPRNWIFLQFLLPASWIWH